jgi:hypothetical protein
MYPLPLPMPALGDPIEGGRKEKENRYLYRRYKKID